MLASLAGAPGCPRLGRADRWAARAPRAMRDFQELGSELAFLRERIVRGSASPESRSHELALLAAMSAQRAQFMPVPRALAGAPADVRADRPGDAPGLAAPN